MNIRKSFYIIFGSCTGVFLLIVFILQIYFGSNIGTFGWSIHNYGESINLIDSIYTDWWSPSLKKVSSNGVKDIYEVKNTYENLNIVVRDSDINKEILLNEILIDNIPLYEYEFEIVKLSDGRSIIKIPISEFDQNNENKLTKVISIYNRYDNILYNIEIDSFEFRFNFSKDYNFLYLNFENYISNFHEKEFKIKSNRDIEDNSYSFGHINKSLKLPLKDIENNNLSYEVVETLFKETTSFTLYNRFLAPVMSFSVTSSGDLKISNTYSLSNVYESELNGQVFTFDSKEDNLFKIERLPDSSFNITNIIDNYRVYFDKDLMRTYKVYNNEERDDLINFKMYRDLRNGRYVFTPNANINTYKLYDVKENKFLSYDKDINEFSLKEEGSDFIITDDNKIFDVKNRVFMSKKDKGYKYIGEKSLDEGDIFKFNDLNNSIFKKINYEEIEKEILYSNHIEVMFKNKETGEFLKVNSGSKEALSGDLHNDYYLNSTFNYGNSLKDLKNFIFEITPNNEEFLTFNIYSKVMGSTLNTDYGIINNKLIFDESKDDKLSFIIEKNEGKDYEFKIKDNYGSYLSFYESDDFARVTSSGFIKKFFNSDDDLDVFQIYMMDFNTIDNIDTGDYISLSSLSNKYYLDKVTNDSNNQLGKSLDEYVVFKYTPIIFLDGENLTNDMVGTKDYMNLKGIHFPLISKRDGDYTGYAFKILDTIKGT